MKKLTPIIFKANLRKDSIIEIIKNVNGIIEFILVPSNSVKIENNIVYITDKVFNQRKDFFRNVRSMYIGRIKNYVTRKQ